jgi:hypothetical protein
MERRDLKSCRVISATAFDISVATKRGTKNSGAELLALCIAI